jgi:ABC-2 type transport system ATP-binding protein
VLDVRDTLSDCPVLPGYISNWIDSHSFEVEIAKSQSINEVFNVLNEQNIFVVSMRNKTNRLEELFFDMVQRNLMQLNETSSSD